MRRIELKFPDDNLTFDKSPIPLGVGVTVKFKGVEYKISSVLYNLDTDTTEVYLIPKDNYFTKLPHLRI